MLDWDPLNPNATAVSKASSRQEARCQKTPKRLIATQLGPVESPVSSLPHPNHPQILLALPSKSTQHLPTAHHDHVTRPLSSPTCCSFLTTPLSLSQVYSQHSSQSEQRSQTAPPQRPKPLMASG